MALKYDHIMWMPKLLTECAACTFDKIRDGYMFTGYYRADNYRCIQVQAPTLDKLEYKIIEAMYGYVPDSI